MYFNRRVMLYNRQGETKIFEFDTQQKEDEVLNSGNWKENPLDFLPAQIQTESEVLTGEEKASEQETRGDADEKAKDEDELQKGHEVEIKEPSEKAAPVPFQCPKCEFIGKNNLSLKAHTRHRH